MQERKERQKKQFQNLTIRDDFMFAAVLADEEICRQVLSLALGTPVSPVEVVPERTVRYHPEFRGVRLDISARLPEPEPVSMWRCRGEETMSRADPDIIIHRWTWVF
ncbi:MAG: hypothetical protein ACLRT5_03100 [Lachnospiraceae bacterium]